MHATVTCRAVTGYFTYSSRGGAGSGIMEDQKEQDRIRRRAYDLWERQGSPEGRAEEFWEQAKSILAEVDLQSASTASESPSDPNGG
jgi:hypothetical protein